MDRLARCGNGYRGSIQAVFDASGIMTIPKRFGCGDIRQGGTCWRQEKSNRLWKSRNNGQVQFIQRGSTKVTCRDVCGNR